MIMRIGVAAAAVVTAFFLGLTVVQEPAGAPAEVAGVVSDSPAEPFQVELTCSFNGSAGCTGSTIRVPVGKRFVVQTLSGWARTRTRTPVTEFRFTATRTRLVRFHMLGRGAVSYSSGTTDSVADARQVTLYADPNTALTMAADAASNTTGTALVSASGYLVPVP
jgi:hypothetical protein